MTTTDELREALDWWHREMSPEAHGWLGTTVGVTDSGTYIAVVRYDTQESSWRTADLARQGKWWFATAGLFEGKVIIHGCARVRQYLGGGSDSAGFVQVIQGQLKDADRMDEIIRRCEPELGAFRPDLIGGTAALHESGLYTETAYFTSEKEARAGERKEPPPRLREAFGELLTLFEGEPAYYDLRDPWLYSPIGT
ncbi:hypothetical protein [Nonomuraea sp. NPDC048916]|uniref:hypothetical protein n=1 Tax=Nonomuraea sp. NPDC048916 TaxID=3154232 RepID=UPI0034085AB8